MTSTPTTAITETPITASILINGNPIRNETLVAVITDIDGIAGGISYQWLSKKTGQGWTTIAGETQETLLLNKTLVGKQIRVIADYLSGDGITEHLISGETAFVSNINNLGVATISGSPVAGSRLIVSVTDEDEIIDAEINYQWQSSENSGESWQDILGEISEELILTGNLVGKIIKCTANYVDDIGTQENLVSNISNVILPAPELGEVSISGIPRQYYELTAVITDANGVKLNSESYQWQKSIDSFDWENIPSATTSTLYLSVNLITYYIRVNAIYTTEVDTPVNIFSQPTDQVYSSLQKTDYLRMLNPLALVPSPNTTFTFRSEQQWVIDEETGNFIPGDTDNVVLVTATLKQQKDPNLVVQPGVDYNRIYFEGYLLTPKIKIDAEQGRNVLTVLNGRQGLFDFIPVMESVEEISLAQRQVNGQMVAGYFRFS